MLRANKENMDNENDTIKNEYSKIEKEKTDEILFLNIEISNLQKKLEEKDQKKKEYAS